MTSHQKAIGYRLGMLAGRLRTALFLLFRAPGKALRLRRLSQAPIVIGGCGRSGTTLLLSLMSCHPALAAIDDETGGLCPRPRKKKGRIQSPIRMWRVYAALAASDISDTASRWCEKTPRNARNYGAILDYFGSGVRILNVVRDGRDVVTSYHGFLHTRAGKTVDYLSKEDWINDVEDGRRYENHAQVMTVRYEDLVRDMQGSMRKICAFLDLDYAPEFDQFPATAKIGRLKADQRPVSVDSLERWRKPENKQSSEAILQDSKARALLEHYGYPLQ